MLPFCPQPKPEPLDRVRNRKRRQVGQVRSRLREVVMEQARCVVCGLRATEMHHVRYRSRGGADTVDNVAALCGHHHRAVHAKWLRLVKTDTGWRCEWLRGRSCAV
jgi:5-methylcytosine-specific restriction endonuclease McrA